MPIPDNFKKYTTQIKTLRSRLDPNFKLSFLGADPDWLKDTYYTEALIQLLLTLKPVAKSKNFFDMDLKENYKIEIASIALAIKDFNLLKGMLKNIPSRNKNLLFVWCASTAANVDDETELNNNIDRINALLDNGVDINVIDPYNKTILDNLSNGQPYNEDFNQKLINFLMSKGAKTYAELTAMQKGL